MDGDLGESIETNSRVRNDLKKKRRDGRKRSLQRILKVKELREKKEIRSVIFDV